MDASLHGACRWDTTLVGAGFLTRGREPVWGQWVGSLLGRSPPKGYRRRPGFLRMVGNHSKSHKGRRGVCDTDGGAGTKVGLSDPVEFKWNAIAQRIKATLVDNRLITPKSSDDGEWFGTSGCRLIASRLKSVPKGWAVRPLKAYASWFRTS